MQPKISARLAGQRQKNQAPVVKADLTGKTVCVLGANTGIGFETCKHFAKMNAGRIILACRSQTRGQEAVERLKKETGYTMGELWIVDLADFQSVKRFADQWESDGGRLDILVANAALEPGKFFLTKDGWESTLQVNHLATSFVILLLLPRILQTAKENETVSRIVLVSSELLYDVVVEKEARAGPASILRTLANPEYLKDSKRMQQQYSVTKLINLFFARALNAHLGASAPVIVNAVAPGFCVSELRRDLAGAFKYTVKVMEWLFALPTEHGSRRLVFAAVGLPQTEDTLRGQYINNCEVWEPSDFVIRAEGRKTEQDLWAETLDILGKLDHRIGAVVERYLSA
ncbi:short-chain dehydrogenase [Mycena galopus ATCC 62051]|nr:short-chain dehydrogenase [Mycena galopus ATCC 62051]